MNLREREDKLAQRRIEMQHELGLLKELVRCPGYELLSRQLEATKRVAIEAIRSGNSADSLSRNAGVLDATMRMLDWAPARIKSLEEAINQQPGANQ